MNKNPSLLVHCLAIVIGLLLGRADIARAEQPDPKLSASDWELRRRLINEATAAHGKGDHKKALELAQRAAAMSNSTKLWYLLAREHEETGALVDAFAAAQRCKMEAERDKSLSDREQVIATCSDMLTRLRERVAYIVVHGPETEPQGLSVKLSGQALNRAALGIPYLVRPGKIAVEAVAPGYQPFFFEIDVAEGKTVNVSIYLQPDQGGARVAAAGRCPPGQRPTANGRCIADDCQVGMVRASDGVHCCWPGQTWAAGAGCTGLAQCPPPLVARGDGCVSLEAGAAATAAAEPGQPTLVARADASPGKAETLRTTSAGLLIGSAVLLAGGAASWVGAHVHHGWLMDACGSAEGCTPSAHADGTSTVKLYSRLAKVGIIGGALAGIAGGALRVWATGLERGQHAREVSPVAVEINPLAASASLQLRF